MKSLIISLLLTLIYLLANTANAAIVGGTVTIIPPPLNTGNDNQQINEILGFDELQHVTLTSDLVVDKPSGIIPAGTIVSSHYIIYDPPGTLTYITGNVILDQNVVGVIYSTEKLNNSDHLGLTTTNYLNPTLRGFETASGDSATIIDPNTVSFDLGAGTPGDYARVITASDYTIQGPQFIMRTPKTALGGVHTNENGIGSVRLLFDQPISFQSDDVTVTDENSQSVTAFATGSGSPFMIITFQETLLTDKYTITVHDTVTSVDTGSPIDGDNDGNAGGDYIFTMEHRERHDSENDNDIDFYDLANFANNWLWME
jgi:hypothetical protein